MLNWLANRKSLLAGFTQSMMRTLTGTPNRRLIRLTSRNCGHEPLEARTPILGGLHGRWSALSQAPRHDESADGAAEGTAAHRRCRTRRRRHARAGAEAVVRGG